tara:strand:- start:385 stop:897 length:513 start_codon:yes stop_codon:yes gene_type:complete
MSAVCNIYCFEPLTKKTIKNMTLQEAENFFESLKNETTKKAEIEVYGKFLIILAKLKMKQFTIEEIQVIETELDSLGLKSNLESGIKFFNKALIKFESFLKETFSLTSTTYYTMRGIALGTAFGSLFGVVFLSTFERSLGITLGLIGGMLIGLVIGRNMDAKAKSEGRVI